MPYLSVILMIIRKDDTYYQKAVDEISGLFRVSCVLNIVWIVTFSYMLIELSTLFILAFVITLALLNLKLMKIQEGKRWLLPAAFGIYKGWLLVDRGQRRGRPGQDRLDRL